jgi:hypothetical protein
VDASEWISVIAATIAAGAMSVRVRPEPISLSVVLVTLAAKLAGPPLAPPIRPGLTPGASSTEALVSRDCRRSRVTSTDRSQQGRSSGPA